MKPPNCGTTLSPLHFGHVGFVFSRSEMVIVSSNGFLHVSQRNSYRGMRLPPLPGVCVPCGRRYGCLKISATIITRGAVPLFSSQCVVSLPAWNVSPVR
jgi:hypothetical protein